MAARGIAESGIEPTGVAFAAMLNGDTSAGAAAYLTRAGAPRTGEPEVLRPRSGRNLLCGVFLLRAACSAGPTPAANSSRMQPSQPRVSRRSRVSACGLRHALPAKENPANQPAGRLTRLRP